MSKQTAKQGVKQTAKQTAKQAVKQAVKQAAKQIVKQAGQKIEEILKRRDSLQKVRLELLKEIQHKGYMHYMEQLKDLKRRIDDALQYGNLKSDTLFQDFFGTSPWYTKESPWLATREYVVIGNLFKLGLRESHIKQFSTKEEQVEQVTVLMETLLTSYYTYNPRLRPVMLNIELAYANQANGLQSNESSWLRRTVQNTALTMLSAAFSGSGPFVLKLLQQFNDDNKTEVVGGITVNDIVTNIFDSVPDLSTAELDELLKHIPFQRKNLKKALGSASLASVYMLELSQDDLAALSPTPVPNGSFVLKYLKPMYIYYFLCECDFLLSEVWVKVKERARTENMAVQIRQLILFLIKLFIEEFEYDQEARYTVLGKHVYSSPPIYTTQLIAVDVQQSPWIVTSLAPGSSLKKVLESRPSQPYIQKIYKSMLVLFKIWFREAFFRTGFFHADLHSGNMHVGQDGSITLIDFGSVGFLNKRVQPLLIKGIFTCESFKEYPDPANLKVAIKFIGIMLKLCEVKERAPKAEVERLANAILDYNTPEWWTFGVLIRMFFKKINMAQYSFGIGSCTYNVVLTFGKAIAYLQTAIKKVEKLCQGQCTFWNLAALVGELLMTHPRKSIELIF